TQYTEKEGLSKNIVRSILEDKNGNLWFGTDGGGVSKYNGESFTHYTEKEGLSNNRVLSILEDKNGNLWFGTLGGGVSKYNGASFTHYTEKEGLSNNRVMSILEDKNGNLWFGTDGGGVSKYNGESFTHYTEKEGLSKNIVRSILEDKNGNLWFGTDGGGVSKYNGESFIHYTEKEGLSNNIVWSILEDKFERVWVGTEKGLSYLVAGKGHVVHPQNEQEKTTGSLTQQSKLYTFVKADGLKGSDFYTNSNLVDSKNRAWWGTGKGLVMLDLNTFKISDEIPQPRLTGMDINEQFLDYRNISDSLGNEIAFNGVQKFENIPLNLSLPYNKNHLTFHFAGIDWSAPHKIQYSYRMLGLDNNNWSNPSKEAKAEYRNLPFGKHTFQVRTIGASQHWSKPFEYTFTIRPPWWKTWWAFSIYFITLVGSVWYYIKWRERALKQRQIELEKTVAVRTAEVVEEKNRSEELLLNILPKEVAEELKHKGEAEARQIDEVTVLFTDFKGFTSLSEKLSPKDLVQEIHACFSAFDIIMQKHGVEKIKTIGDAYMAAGGLPVPNKSHAGDVVSAALEIQKYMEQHKIEKQASGELFFEIRIGVHTGPVVAGIVGVKKFAYDIWGDTVNTASRMESSGEVGKVNISGATYEKVKDQFLFIPRGKIQAKGKGEVDMYFVLEKMMS
ncbi:MAG: adenylate/guanylate cyclase domain-containing protein, partial [Bacteroidota bacterium]